MLIRSRAGVPASFLRIGLRAGLVLVAVTTLAATSCKKTDAPASTQATPTATTPAVPAGPGKFGTGSIRGVAHFGAKPPERHAITTPDPFCATQKLQDEDVIVGSTGGLKNVLVHVSEGASGTYEPPKTAAIVDQTGCTYHPRVQAVLVGQAVDIRNSDQTLHNVHSYKGASTLFNQAQIPGTAPLTKTMTTGGQIIKFRCDVHPWMTGYVGVLSNPFFAVTGEDGSFTIDKLPAGTYTLEAWHERSGVKTSAAITIADGQSATANFEF